MAARKRTPFQREEDLVQITRLYLQGRTQRDIAEVVGVSQGQVNHDLKLIQQRWRESSIMDMNEAKQKELSRIDEVERITAEAGVNALRDVSPSFSMNNRPYGTLIDAIQCGYVSLLDTLLRHLSDFYHIGAVNFCAWVEFAKGVIIALFVRSIAIVFSGSAKPEMIGVNAAGVVALVANVHALGDWAMTQLVANTMSAVEFLVGTNRAVPARNRSSLPHPTVIGAKFFDFFPKPFGERAHVWFGVYATRAIVSGHKACGLPLYVSNVGARALCEWCRLSASAFTKFYLWFLCGILGHVVSSFQLSAKPGIVLAIARCFYWVHRCNYTIKHMEMEVRRRRFYRIARLAHGLANGTE